MTGGKKAEIWHRIPEDIYIAAAAAITWLIKYNQRICYIIINSRSVFLLALLSDVKMNS